MSKKNYSMYSPVIDADGNKHVVTVVGEYTQHKEYTPTVSDVSVELNEYKHANGMMIIPISQKVRRFKMAYSICHPSDTFNEDVGIAIAKSRLKRDAIGEVSSTDITMLNDDMCNMMVFTELQFIKKNIEKYLPTEA